MGLLLDKIARNNFNLKNKTIIASTDECGAGCLFGPVVAAAVILKDTFDLDEVNDSKKLSEKKRKYLSEIIKENCISYSIVEIDNNKIDEINILQARMLAMGECFQQLSLKPEHLLIDGNYFRDILKLSIPYTTVIKGDTLYQSIAAASILAKVYRDELIQSLSKQYEGYDLFSNKGYLTKKHIDGLRKLGLTDLHRKSFNVRL